MVFRFRWLDVVVIWPIYWFWGQNQSFQAAWSKGSRNDCFWPENQYFFKTTSQTNHMDLNTIEEENVWKYFLVPWDPLGASRVPNLAPSRGIFEVEFIGDNSASGVMCCGTAHHVKGNGKMLVWMKSLVPLIDLGSSMYLLFQHSRAELFKYSTEEPKPFVLEDETQTSVFAKTQQISAK